MFEIDHIEIRPDAFGWELLIHVTALDPDNQSKIIPWQFGIGDAIQFHAETERTIGRWLADGPADFHASVPYDQEENDPPTMHYHIKQSGAIEHYGKKEDN